MEISRLPNVLVITCHDLGRFLGCYGVRTVRTPNLDRLAADGIRFANHFCTAPQCSCSRASLFTGRYPHSTGVLGLTHADFGWDMKSDERHLGQTLRDLGYRTAMIGIHHETRPNDRLEAAARCGLEEAPPAPNGMALSEMALERISTYASGDRPFFLHLGFHEPHRVHGSNESDFMGFIGEYIEPDDVLGVTVPPYLRDGPAERREMAEIQGAVAYVDGAIGRVLDGLRELGLEQTTLVIATTDHGLALPRAKCSLYDPGIEGALIVRLPARGWSGGRVTNALVSNVDVFPTVMDLIGQPADNSVHGRSLTPVLDGTTDKHRDEIFAEMTYHDYYDPQRCVRTTRHKLIVNFSNAPSFMNPSQSWRPRSRPATPAEPALAYHAVVELYDLESDPNERENLCDLPEYSHVRADLIHRLRNWMETTGDPLLLGAVTSPMHTRALHALAD